MRLFVIVKLVLLYLERQCNKNCAVIKTKNSRRRVLCNQNRII